MSLLNLPQELLLECFQHLGSSFFREDVGRLAVCTRWYTAAYTVFLTEVDLSAKSLQRLLCSSGKESRAFQLSQKLQYIQIHLRGFEDWPPPLLPPGSTNEPAGSAAITTTWTMALDNMLADLGRLLQNCKRLHTMVFQAEREYYPHWVQPHSSRRNYLFANTLSSLISSLGNITVLELDTGGTHAMPTTGGDGKGEESHICLFISAALVNLRRLRLRMCHICPKVLNPPTDKPLSSLNEVIVNLCHYGYSSADTSITYSRPCPGFDGGRFVELQGEMEAQANLLADRMLHPKVVRILWYSLPTLSLKYWDAVEKKRKSIRDDIDWADDGISEPCDSGSESDISSISSVEWY